MRGLAVYYCSTCGFYGYYQLPKNAVCPSCQLKLTELPMSYQSFMRLEFGLRDQLIADQIAGDVTPHSSIVQRVTELEKSCSTRFTTAKLKSRIQVLEAEKAELQKKTKEQETTISWMHDLIWDLTKRLHGGSQEQEG